MVSFSEMEVVGEFVPSGCDGRSWVGGRGGVVGVECEVKITTEEGGVVVGKGKEGVQCTDFRSGSAVGGNVEVDVLEVLVGGGVDWGEGDG